ncbi:MAG TPA: efflux RND transporter periplasmic adaptor subunit [Polyangiaceae bacterium]|nr:efflux RND transporter periplasmic adaptor subunit [Polyangiaceae bacterium]
MRFVAFVLFLSSGQLLGCAESGAKGERVQDAGGQAHTKKTVKFNAKALHELGIRVDVVGGNSWENRLQVPGSLDYSLEKYAEIGTLVEGRVDVVHVKAGDKVQKGTLLATVKVPTIAAAQAEYLSAKALAKQAGDNLTREEFLRKQELTTAREEEVARAESIRAASAVEAARAKLAILGVDTGSVVRGAGTLRLTSPIDGVVVRREAVTGKYLAPNEVAFVIADPSELRGSLEVFESDIVHFQVGTEVEIRVDAMPDKVLSGKVLLLEPQLGKSTRALRAIVPVANDKLDLKPGLFVRGSVKLATGAATDRLYVPAGAVQPLDDDDVVFVEIEPGNFEVRTVSVARRTAQVVEIAQGISKGERIALEGAFLLRAEVTKQ